MVEETKKADKTTIIVHSGDMDKIYSALNICKWGSIHGDGSIPLLHILGTSTSAKRRTRKRTTIQDAFPWTWKMDDKKPNEKSQCSIS